MSEQWEEIQIGKRYNDVPKEKFLELIDKYPLLPVFVDGMARFISGITYRSNFGILEQETLETGKWREGDLYEAIGDEETVDFIVYPQDFIRFLQESELVENNFVIVIRPNEGTHPGTFRNYIPCSIQKGFVGRRLYGETIVNVVHDGIQTPLKHQVLHSPPGMAWGYGGNGAADLAYSILCEVTDINTAHKLYWDFKREFIECLRGDDPWEIDWETVERWITQKKLNQRSHD